MKFALCNELYTERTVFEAIESASKLGYHGLELAPFTLTDNIPAFPIGEQRRIARCAGDEGIAILGLHWLLASPKGLHVTSPDNGVRGKTLEVFKKLIEVCVNTGGRLLTLGSPNQRSFAEDVSPAEAEGRFLDFMAELLPEIESSGVMVCLEPLEGGLTNFINRTGEACRIADAIGSPSIGITLDTHFLRWEKEQFGVSEAEAFETAGTRVKHLHIQDDNSRAPGTGSADFSGFIRTVKEIRYGGYISMETFEREEGEEGQDIAEAGISFFRREFL